MSALPNIVLVHGAWADGSSWSAVIERLQADGYDVTAPQFPMNALADNVARLRLVLSRQEGPTIVAGHSYPRTFLAAPCLLAASDGAARLRCAPLPQPCDRWVKSCTPVDSTSELDALRPPEVRRVAWSRATGA